MCRRKVTLKKDLVRESKLCFVLYLQLFRLTKFIWERVEGESSCKAGGGQNTNFEEELIESPEISSKIKKEMPVKINHELAEQIQERLPIRFSCREARF